MHSDDLFEEKSLFDIYWASVTRLPRTRFNVVVLWISAGLLIASGFILWDRPEKMVEGARSLAEVGLNFGSQILGFLVGGFAIFASVSKPEFFLFLNEARHKESGLTYLKYNLFSFVKVFVPYLSLISISLVIKSAGYQGGPAGEAFSAIRGALPTIAYPLIGFSAFAIMGLSLVWCVLSLKSFIFNLYHIIATVITWEKLRPKAVQQIRGPQ
jgi:hypothetical protein